MTMPMVYHLPQKKFGPGRFKFRATARGGVNRRGEHYLLVHCALERVLHPGTRVISEGEPGGLAAEHDDDWLHTIVINKARTHFFCHACGEGWLPAVHLKLNQFDAQTGTFAVFGYIRAIRRVYELSIY